MKKCKMCTHIYDDSMGFCPECGALDFEPVAKPAEKKPDPAPATDSYAWGEPRSSSSLNAENKAFEPVKVQEKKPEPAQPAQNTPASNTNNGSCLGTLIKWVFYFFAFFIVIYIITEVL